MDNPTDFFTRYPDAMAVLAWFLAAGLPVTWLVSVFMTRDSTKSINLMGPLTSVVFGSAILYRLHSWPF